MLCRSLKDLALWAAPTTALSAKLQVWPRRLQAISQWVNLSFRRRQKSSSKLLSDLDYEDDDFSTDGESLFDAPLGLKSFKASDGKAKQDASQP